MRGLMVVAACAIAMLLPGCGPAPSASALVSLGPAASVLVSPSPPAAAEPAEVDCPTVGAPATTPAATPPDVLLRPALDGVLALFDETPFVVLGEYHGWVAEHAFFASLVCDPAFPRVVDAIVVEFGNRRLQPVLDRYIAGERVTTAELASVWRESTQRSGVWEQPVYARLFALVRTVNRRLAVDDRVRVLAGDPAIDWSSIRRSTDCASQDPTCLDYWLERRDASIAEVALDAGKPAGGRVLVIAGVGHVVRREGEERPPSVADLIDLARPGGSSVVIPHHGFGGLDPDSEARIGTWPILSLANLDGSWIGDLDSCLLDGGSTGPGGPACPSIEGRRLNELADSYLYLGPT